MTVSNEKMLEVGEIAGISLSMGMSLVTIDLVLPKSLHPKQLCEGFLVLNFGAFAAILLFLLSI